MPDGLRESLRLPGCWPAQGPRRDHRTPRCGSSTARDAFDDGWGTLADFAELPPLPTNLLAGTAKSAIIARNDCPDIGFDRSINPYRGCEHGCVYCYARPSHAYSAFRRGSISRPSCSFKPDAPRLLEKELRKPGYAAEPIAHRRQHRPLPADRARACRSRAGCWRCWTRFNHPVTIVTKSALVLRDLDILARMARAGPGACVPVSVTTLDRELARGWSRAPPRRDGGCEAIRR